MALLLLILIARLWDIQSYATFLSDQGRDAIVMRNIATLKDFTGIGPTTSIGNVFLGPFYYYFMAPFLLVFNFNPVGPAVGVALLSVILLAWCTLIVKKEFGERVALWFLAFCAVSSSLYFLSRFSWNPNLLPYTAFLTLYYGYRLIKEKKVRDGVIAGLLLSASVQFHYLAYLLIVPLGMYALVFIKHTVKAAKPLLYGALAFILLLSPLILFDIKNNFINTKALVRTLLEQGGSGTREYLPTTLVDVTDKFIDFTLLPGQNFILHVNTNNTLFAVMVIALLGSLWLIKRKAAPVRRDIILLNVINIMSFLLLFAALNSPRIIHYFGNVYLSLYFLIAVFFGLETKSAFFKGKMAMLVRNEIVLAGIFLVFAVINIAQYDIFNGPGNKQIHYAREVARSFLPHIHDNNFAVTSLPSPNTDTHINYFLHTFGKPPLSYEQPINPQTLFVICHKAPCALDASKWEIAQFGAFKIATIWQTYDLTVYKLVKDNGE